MARYSGKSLGTFGELGGELVFDWEPDPEEVVAGLMAVEGYLEDLEGPLLLSREKLVNDIRMRFRQKVDPDGNPWQDWAETYERYRMNHYPEGGILVRLPGSGVLRDTATSQEAFIVGEHGIFYNTAGLPEYWAWTQYGAERASGGSSSLEQEAEAYAAFQGTTIEHARKVISEEGRDIGINELPARPYIGTSFEAEVQIFEIFDAWFSGAIELATSPKGKVFGRHSYRVGGRFAKRL